MGFEPISMAVGAGIKVGSALIGWLLDHGQRAEAERLMAEADRLGMDIDAPEFQKLSYSMLPPETLNMFQADPRVQQAFNASYDKLGQIADGGGLTTEDRAVQNRTDSDAARRTHSAYARINQDMASTGNTGGGADVAMRLAAAQDAGNRYHQNSMDASGRAQNRAFDAIMGRAQLAGSQRSADHQEALAKLRIYEYNNNLKNRQMEQNNEAGQINYQNKVNDSERKAGILRGKAKRTSESGVGHIFSGVGDAVGSTIASIGSMGGGGPPAATPAPTSSYQLDPLKFKWDPSYG